jgi:pimeloyl-ACP methyl ester carboxylesterase
LAVSAVGALGLVAEAAFEHAGAQAVIDAPNASRSPPEASAHAELAAMGVSEELAIDVGPPAARISVWIVDAPRPSDTIFLLHGIRSDKRALIGWARRLADHGYRAILIDARGHGASSGRFLTYGVVEARDLSQVLRALDGRGQIVGHVGAMGTSYGAATAIQWAGAEPRVEAVVAVAPFSSLRMVVPEYLHRLVPAIAWLIPDVSIDRALARAGRLADFDPARSSPLEAIARARAQVLLVHGRQDRNIPCSQSEALHARAPSHSQLLLLDGEDHLTIAADRRGRVWAAALPWFASAFGVHPD